MPSGSSSTGRKTPKTPGSRIEGEETAGIGTPSCTGEPARTATLTRRQRIHHEIEMLADTDAHTMNRSARRGSVVCGSAASTGAEPVMTVNGWTTSITTDTLGEITGGVRHSMRLPT